MPEKIQISKVIPASPQKIYSAWMESKSHTEFTGDTAEIDPVVGGKFTAWGGYISGTNLILEPGKRIVQAWRTTEFPEDAPDSNLEVLMEPKEEGALVTIIHTNIPDGQGEDYRNGWIDYYFEPLMDYFG